ncbi:MAG TPA: hypothetical protein VI078_14145 [bacterium]
MSRRELAGAATAIAVFLAISAYLGSVDVFTADYAATGARMALYNLARTAFIPYFIWLVAGTGWLSLAALRRFGVRFDLGWADRCLLGFFLGAAVLTVAMLPLGFANLYYRPTALLLAVPILAFSFPHLLREAREAAALLRGLLAPGRRLEAAVGTLLAAALLAVAAVLLLTRALYPGEASNDAYEIYWPYQRLVVQSHGIWPNDIWYMFYGYKTMGLNFLAMLLADDTACQLVTFCLLLAGVGAVVSLARKACGDRTWALLAGVASIACFPFSNPEWGAFQSHHIQAGAWLVAACWMAVLTFDRTEADRRGWFLVWLAVMVGEALFFPLFLVFVAPMLGVLCLGYLAARRLPETRGVFIAAAGAGAATAGLLLLNYLIAGMFLENPLRPMWTLADQARFARWWTPLFPMFYLEGSAPTTGGVSLSGFLAHDLRYWLRLFRVDTLGALWPHWGAPLALAGVGIAAAVARPAAVTVRWLRLAPVAVPLLVCLVISDSGHPSSVYRNYGFVCFLLPVVLCALWQTAFQWLTPRRARAALGAAAVLVAAGFSLNLAVQRAAKYRPPGVPSRWSDFAGFAAGEISTREALARGDGLWPVAESARDLVGMQARILCLNRPGADGSFLFPGDGLLSQPSRTSFGGKWDVVVFGGADRAAAVLKEQRIDYVLVDFSMPLWGLVPFGPLFDPDHLAERFDLVGWGGNACVLTWRGQGRQPLPPWVAENLRQRVRADVRRADPGWNGIWGRLYDTMAAIRTFNEGKPYPWQRPDGLPRVRGWQ